MESKQASQPASERARGTYCGWEIRRELDRNRRGVVPWQQLRFGHKDDHTLGDRVVKVAKVATIILRAGRPTKTGQPRVRQLRHQHNSQAPELREWRGDDASGPKRRVCRAWLSHTCDTTATLASPARSVIPILVTWTQTSSENTIPSAPDAVWVERGDRWGKNRRSATAAQSKPPGTPTPPTPAAFPFSKSNKGKFNRYRSSVGGGGAVREGAGQRAEGRGGGARTPRHQPSAPA